MEHMEHLTWKPVTSQLLGSPVLTLQGTPNSPTPNRPWPATVLPGSSTSPSRGFSGAGSGLHLSSLSTHSWSGAALLKAQRESLQKGLGRRELPGPRTCPFTLQRGLHPGTSPRKVSLPEPGPSESAEASAVTAPQVKFPLRACTSALTGRGSKTPPPPPPVDSSSGFLPKSAQRRLHTTSSPSPPAPAVPEDDSQPQASPHAHFLGRQGGDGASSPPTLNLDTWTHRVSTMLTPRVTSHRS